VAKSGQGDLWPLKVASEPVDTLGDAAIWRQPFCAALISEDERAAAKFYAALKWQGFPEPELCVAWIRDHQHQFAAKLSVIPRAWAGRDVTPERRALFERWREEIDKDANS
jgi:hypothetical protein